MTGSWTRGWCLWVSRAALGLALAVILTACGVEAGGADPAPAPPWKGSTAGGTRMPPALRASFVSARQQGGTEAYRFERAPSGHAAARNAAHRLDVALSDGALELRRGDAWRTRLRWTGLGRGARVAAVGRPGGEAEVVENRATYRRADGSEEQYVNGPLGVEQVLVLAARPAGERGEAIAVEVSFEGDLGPALLEGGAGVALRDARGTTVARYTDLSAFDADGVPRRSWMEVGQGVVRLRVDDDGARYPLRIDPMTWTQEAALTGSDEMALDVFGASTSISGDTAIVGAPGHSAGGLADVGAAYVFVESGNGWVQQAELAANDGEDVGYFGASVAVSGDTAIVGAAGSVSDGVAYVFVRSGTTWTKEAKLLPGDAPANAEFGASVAVSGGTAIVGAPGNVLGTFPGAAYVFVQSGATWTEEAEIMPPSGAAGDGFGASVSVDGDAAIVGAPNGFPGHAYVFARSGATWTEEAQLGASDGPPDDRFGASVAVSGGTAIVGAPSPVETTLPYPGVAYVFVRGAGTWAQQAELRPCDAQAIDYFGTWVALSGGTAAVGAPGHDAGDLFQAGAVYVFTQSGATWTEEAEITSSDGTESSDFGVVSLSGSNVIVGAPWQVVDGGSAGEAYVFEISGDDPCTPPPDAGTDAGPGELDAGALDDGGPCDPHWIMTADLQAITASDPEILDGSVAVSGDTAIVAGATSWSVAGTNAAFVFVRKGGAWAEEATLTPSDGAPGEDFGSTVAINGDIAIVGAPSSNPGGTVTGAAYVFVRKGGAWAEEAKLTASDGAPGDFFGGAVSLDGDVAIVAASSRVVGGNAAAGTVYVFARSGTTWTQEAELVASDAAANESFGTAVSVGGGTAFIGAPGYALGPNAEPGAVYVFERSGTTWTQEAEIMGEGGGFGDAVSMSGDMAVVGAPFFTVGSAEWSGAVYVFARSGTTWTQETQLFALDGESTDNIGIDVSLSGGAVLAGLRPGQMPPKAYVLVQSGAAWVQQAEIVLGPVMPGEENLITSLSLSGGTAILGGSRALIFEDVGCTPQPDGGAPDAGPPDAGPPDAGDGTGSAFGGCDCSTAPSSAPPLGLPLLAALLGLAARRCRRRSVSGRRAG